MPKTGFARTMAPAQVFQAPQPEQPAIDTEWQVLAIYRAQPPTDQPWHMGAMATVDVDPGVIGEIRLRSSLGNIVTPEEQITAYDPSVVLGFQGIDNSGEQLIYVEGRRVSGEGGLILQAIGIGLMSAPPFTTGETPGETPGTDDVVGWTVEHFDDFATVDTYDNGALGANWTAYDSAGNAGHGLRRTTAVRVVNEALVPGLGASSNGTAVQLEATWDGSNITSGIIQLTAFPQTYGRYRFRVKSSGDPSDQLSPVILMWPDDDIWPAGGEIDIYEGIDERVTLDPMKSFLHRANPTTGLDEQLPALVWEPPHVAYSALGTGWHTWELEWLADRIKITVDDTITQTMTTDEAWIPDIPMKFAIQLDAWGNGALGTPVRMWVDWVEVASPVYSSGETVFPTFESVTTTTNSVNSLSHTFNLPATVNPGDHLIAQVCAGDSDITRGVSLGGWNEIHSDNLHGYHGWRVFHKLADGTEGGGSIGVDTDESIMSAGQVFRISGAFDSAVEGTAFSLSPGTASGYGPGPDPDAVTAAWGLDRNLYIGMFTSGGTGANIVNPPLGFTNDGGSGTAAGVVVGGAHLTEQSGANNPGPFTIDDDENHRAITIAIRPAAASGGGGGPGADKPTPAPTVPTFNAVSATSISPGQDVAAIIAAGSAGDHFRLLAGAHDIDNVLLKTDMHIRFDEGATADGTGINYCFRPESSTTSGVAIGGTGATRPKISNYGNGTTDQGYGAIMGRPHDTLAAVFEYANVENWFIYHIDFEQNSSNAIKMGDYWTVYDCEIHGHSVTGIQCDRGVGGLIHSNEIYWNALNPATGAASNGANIKITWMNGDVGRTSITPIDRAKAQMVISSNIFEALDRNGGPGDANIGVWLDLDCQDVLVEYNTVTAHPNTSIFFEGCNNCEAAHNSVSNSNGFGPAFDANFVNAAIAVGESTNCRVRDNTLTGCDFALMNRLSNRSSDWLDAGGSLNYGHSAGPRYWLLATSVIPAINGQSNIWTGNNDFVDNFLIGCNKVVINEGTDNGTQTTHGATDTASIEFSGNDYSQSPSIEFYDRSNTPLTLAGWQGLGRQ